MYFSWSNAIIVRWRRRCRTPFECRQTSSPWSRPCRISRKPRSIDRSLRRKRTQLRFQQHRPRRKTIRSRWTPASSSNTPRWRKLSPLVSLGRFRPCRPMVWDLVFRKSSLKRDCAAKECHVILKNDFREYTDENESLSTSSTIEISNSLIDFSNSQTVPNGLSRDGFALKPRWWCYFVTNRHPGRKPGYIGKQKRAVTKIDGRLGRDCWSSKRRRCLEPSDRDTSRRRISTWGSFDPAITIFQTLLRFLSSVSWRFEERTLHSVRQ